MILKEAAKSIVRSRGMANKIVRLALRLHNFSYRIAGEFSCYAEPNGLHPKHRLMRYHDWFTERIRPDWSILDIGCGNGALACDLRKHCRSVTGIDVSQSNIDFANNHYSEDGLTFIYADATVYEPREQYDALVLSNVLEHIDDRVPFLRNLYALQNADNPPVLLLRVPLISRDWITLYKKELGLEWRLDPTHYTEYAIEDLYQELGSAGLNVEEKTIQFGEFYGIVRKK